MSTQESNSKIRCFGTKPNQELYAKYHDYEWGIPVHDDQKHFEMLILEGAQAGLNWETILKKREGYRKAFKEFDPIKVAQMSDDELNALLKNPSIIRNRLKIYSARKNAIAFLENQKEYGSYNDYVWQFVGGRPIINHWKKFEDIPVATPESIALSKSLKRYGMSFVGPTIMYAYMQAVGMVFDHLTECWVYKNQC